MGTERQPRTPEVPGSMSMTDPLNNPHHGTTTNSVSKKKLHVLIVTGLSSGTHFTTYAANGFQCKGGTQLDDITFINPLKHFLAKTRFEPATPGSSELHIRSLPHIPEF